MKRITQDRLKELVHYDPETGVIEFFKPNIRRKESSYLDSLGYVPMCIDGHKSRAHRFAWFYVYGVWPKTHIDHINGDKTDNRICNLRVVTHAENVQNVRKARKNSTVGLLGVYAPQTGRSKYRAFLQVGGKRHKLGAFATPEEAHAAYVQAKRQLHPGCTL